MYSTVVEDGRLVRRWGAVVSMTLVAVDVGDVWLCKSVGDGMPLLILDGEARAASASSLH